MIEFPWLLADLDDWIRVIIILIFVAGPILNQFGGGKKKKPAQPRRRPAPPAAGAGGGNAMENEIEAFLREAQQKKDAGQPKPRQPGPAQPQPARPRPQRPAAARPKKRTQPQPAARQQQRPQLGEGVARHVEEHIKSHPVSEKSTRLGERVRLADEKVEQHLHAVFDHRLGQLDQDATMDVSMAARSRARQQQDRQALEAQSQVADIRRILSDPTAIREAILLTEILQPPLGLRE